MSSSTAGDQSGTRSEPIGKLGNSPRSANGRSQPITPRGSESGRKSRAGTTESYSNFQRKGAKDGQQDGKDSSRSVNTGRTLWGSGGGSVKTTPPREPIDKKREPPVPALSLDIAKLKNQESADRTEGAADAGEAPLTAFEPVEIDRQRKKLRGVLQQLDRLLEESTQALKLRPSKRDKLTAASYHLCFRHLNWAIGRCTELQDEAALLEGRDGKSLTSASAGLEYALLGVEIIARQDRAGAMLDQLTCIDLQIVSDRGGERHSQEAPHKPVGFFSDWFSFVVTSCGGRVCGAGSEGNMSPKFENPTRRPDRRISK